MRTLEIVSEIINDLLLFVDIFIITMAVVKIWRAKLFKDIEGMTANRKTLVLHIVLLSVLVISQIACNLMNYWVSKVIYHGTGFIISSLI